MSSQPCPSCGTQLPVDPRFITWCHACGWNLVGATAAPAATTALERLSESVGRRLGDRMADRLAESGRLAPRLTPAKVAAYAIAIVVHAFVLALVAAGVWLLAGDANIGKSTSTLALVAAGWHFAADDAVYVTHSPGAGVTGHGWAEPIRLTARSATALGVERDVPQSELKSNAVLGVSVAARRVDSMGLHRVCFPEFGAETSLRPIGAREALERLLAASAWIVCVPALAKAYLATLTAVASLPASVVVLGPELLEQPELLAEHLSCAAEVAA